MKKVFRLLYIILILTSITISGQNSLVIRKRSNSIKTKRLEFNREYFFKTHDTLYRSRIIGADDSTLQITKFVLTNDSFALEKTTPYNPRPKYYKRYQKDTINLSYRDIIYIKKNLLNITHGPDPIFVTLVCGGIGVLISEVAIHNVSTEAKVGLGFLGGIVGIAIPIFFIGTRKTTLDMQHKWTFK